MPIYEYKCGKCGVVEVMQRITESPLKKCPNCKRRVERMISPTSFVLKGTGWYATDYAKKGSAPPSDTTSTGNGSESKNTATSSNSDATASKSSDKASDGTSEKASTSEKTKSSEKTAAKEKSVSKSAD